MKKVNRYFFSCTWLIISLVGIALLTQSCKNARNRSLKDSNSLYEAGIQYYNNKNYLEALKFYKSAAAKDHAEAMSSIGWMYRKGEGVEIDYKMAMQWYRKAASRGSTSAMINIGWMYDFAEGVTEDDEKAMEWYNKAARAG